MIYFIIGSAVFLTVYFIINIKKEDELDRGLKERSKKLKKYYDRAVH